VDLPVLEGALHAPYEMGRIGMRVCTPILCVSKWAVTLSTTCIGLQRVYDLTKHPALYISTLLLRISHHRQSSDLKDLTCFDRKKADMAANTKESGVEETQVSSGLKSIDDAWSYLNSQHRDSHDAESIDIKALRRKIDRRIVPLMFGCYTMQFLDKVILNVSYNELEQHRTNGVPVLSRHGYSKRLTSCWK
jgi:hypothetical protein